MTVQPMSGFVKLFNSWHPVIEISKLNAETQSPDDRVFLKEPIKIPNTSYSRKSFKRSEIQKYKPS
jgi:hypothetical protein